MYRSRLGKNRIAPNTGVNFLLMGLTLLLFDWRPRPRSRPAELVVLLPIAIAVTSSLGDAYGVDELYGIGRYT